MRKPLLLTLHQLKPKNMIYRSLLVLTITFAFFACTESSKFSKPELAEQKKAWDVMIEGHDRAMPLISEMHQAAKSLDDIAEKSAVAADNTHPRAMQALEALKNADDDMFDWMDHISENRIDSVQARSADHKVVMEFIAAEQKSIDLVEESMNNSLKQAKALIQEKSGL